MRELQLSLLLQTSEAVLLKFGQSSILPECREVLSSVTPRPKGAKNNKNFCKISTVFDTDR